MNGYIKLHRQILRSDTYKNLNSKHRDVLHICLLLANHQGNEWEWQGEIYRCEPGEFISSLQNIADFCAKDVRVQNVRTALLKLEKWGFLTNKSTKTGRLIKIDNWDKFQGSENKTNKETNKRLTKSQQSSNKELTTNKNEKNVKNNLDKSKLVEKPKSDNRNENINLILQEFKELTGFSPTDKYPRRVAWNMVQRIHTWQKEQGFTVDKDRTIRLIRGYFKWLQSQKDSEESWLMGLQKLETVKLKLTMYQAIVNKKIKKGNDDNQEGGQRPHGETQGASPRSENGYVSREERSANSPKNPLFHSSVLEDERHRKGRNSSGMERILPQMQPEPTSETFQGVAESKEREKFEKVSGSDNQKQREKKSEFGGRDSSALKVRPVRVGVSRLGGSVQDMGFGTQEVGTELPSGEYLYT